MEPVECEVTSFEEFVMEIRKMTPEEITLREEYWFRGQSDSTWGLDTSLMRSSCKLDLSLDELTDLETVARKAFQWTAHLHVKPELLAQVRTIPCWWALMQHHGAPTRILDWSLSPYVAAYFAVLQEGTEAAGAVWAFCSSHLANSFRRFNDGKAILSFDDANAADWYKERIETLKGKKIVIPLSFPHASTERIVAQQGRFTMSFDINSSHDTIRTQIDPGYFRVIKIPHKKKPEFLLRLRTMNITGASLFPGVDGLGKSMKEIVSLGRFYNKAICPAAGSPHRPDNGRP